MAARGMFLIASPIFSEMWWRDSSEKKVKWDLEGLEVTTEGHPVLSNSLFYSESLGHECLLASLRELCSGLFCVCVSCLVVSL